MVILDTYTTLVYKTSLLTFVLLNICYDPIHQHHTGLSVNIISCLSVASENGVVGVEQWVWFLFLNVSL